ncbi:MAG TPA: radical SAM family heme chaperone HemW [Terriglobales bacterium]|nr:radical SAM family heme chaperone HemW [Terriglobales bacterium]
MPIGIYISIPFCRSKCTFCNFASGVFSRDKMDRYVSRLEQEIAAAESRALSLGAAFERTVDSVYLGGGTPTTFSPEHLSRIFSAVHNTFDAERATEVTVECAPGTLRPEILATLRRNGTNRVSLGVQSFSDAESSAVGRLHTAQQVRNDIAHLRQSGITNINIDLIAGLPHQTAESWRDSLTQLIDTGAPHASVYILEVDEDSRLGRELIAGGSRYHAHEVPNSDLSADLYLEAVEFLNTRGLKQYEISNFAQPGFESRHNLKYWTREPYLGFGLDAHSMMPAYKPSRELESVRWSNGDDLDDHLAGTSKSEVTQVSTAQAQEEIMFLGLRLNRGVESRFVPAEFNGIVRELTSEGLLERCDDRVRLTDRGRLLSNEVFEQFISLPVTTQ